jgi:hypothetical protein
MVTAPGWCLIGDHGRCADVTWGVVKALLRNEPLVQGLPATARDPRMLFNLCRAPPSRFSSFAMALPATTPATIPTVIRFVAILRPRLGPSLSANTVTAISETTHHYAGKSALLMRYGAGNAGTKRTSLAIDPSVHLTLQHTGLLDNA